MGKVIPGPGYVEPVKLICSFGNRWREITAVVGAKYEVRPLNPQKQKHRGRQCEVLDFVRDDIGHAQKVEVRFLDNGRRGRVDMFDLFAEGLTRAE